MTIARGPDGATFALRRTALFFGYLFCALSIGAVLSYPLVQTGWIDYEPQRIMGRIAQLLILLGLWPFLRWLSLADRGSLGFTPPRAEFLRAIRLGWLLGVAMLVVLVLAELVLEIRVPDDDWADEIGGLLSKALAALLGGLLIGLGEELFFRGALYTSIRRGSGVAAAAGFSALLYALVHFLKPHALPDGVAFDWLGVWTMFVGVFAGLFQWQHLDSLVALVAAGVLLALVRERTGHIGWCIGLHAGWVFVIQLTRRVTDGNDASGLAFLVGGYDGVIGWMGAAWIALLALAYWRMTMPSAASEPR